MNLEAIFDLSDTWSDNIKWYRSSNKILEQTASAVATGLLAQTLTINNKYNNSSVFCHIDVQNVSTYRMRFQVVAQAEVTVYAATDDVRTLVQFERIANT